MVAFRTFCVVLALAAAACFQLTGKLGEACAEIDKEVSASEALPTSGDVECGGGRERGVRTWRDGLRMWWGMLRNGHFMRVVAVNFAQVRAHARVAGTTVC